MLDVFFAPTKVFTYLKEKPRWAVAFVIVLVVVTVVAAVSVGVAREEILGRQAEAMRQRGLTEEQMEQALSVASGPLLYISSAIGAAIFTALLLVVFAFLLNVFVPVFGGTAAFKTVFSLVSHTALVRVLAAIVKLILIIITKSIYVTTSLALFVPSMARESFGYQLLNGCDFFIIWEMILVAIGINITNNVPKKSAYVLVFIIWVASLFVGASLSTLRGPGA
jgi:hypothetical protein